MSDESDNNPALPRTGDRPIVRTVTEMRQGVTGHGVRWVLLISTVLAVVAMIVSYAAAL